MSTPTNRDPDERDPHASEPAPAADTTRDATGPVDPTAQTTAATTPTAPVLDAGAGQHAAARPYPPVPPLTTPDVSPLTTPGPSPLATPGNPVTTSAGKPQATPGNPVAGVDRTAVLPASAGLTGAAAAGAAAAAERRDTRRALREDPEVVDRQLAIERETEHQDAVARLRIAEERQADEERALAAARRDLPERPSRPGIGRHLLGVLLGLVLTPVALLLVGIGVERLRDATGNDGPASDALGLTLLGLAVLLLVVVVLLGVWSPAVPLTGGLVWGVALGVMYLFLPGVVEDVMAVVAGGRVLPAAADELGDHARSGALLVTGGLLVAAGLVAGLARRAGRRWAQGVATADAAAEDVRRRESTVARAREERDEAAAHVERTA
ncbi:hypothetical protein [Actinotalea subterranea]|uniref:hypothetical protein n=1 Tax=Actinotalea subterranea TaxID=2607497 RepID=UPI0011EC6EA9|nr:hypothetical protein [Actinotalea subterranea]